MTNGNKKILSFLEKIRGEWDLIPKESNHYQIQAGYSAWPKHVLKMRIGPSRIHKWQRESGIEDFHQLENMLKILKEEGLIYGFEFHDDME